METTLLVTSYVLVTVLFFVVGGIVGWIANKHFWENRPLNLHPEFIDEHGNIIPDEILSVRFEKDYFSDYDSEENEEDI